MERISACWLFLLILFPLSGQENPYPTYGVEKSMPVYYEHLREQLTFPMAWGRSDTKDFDIWKKNARAVVWECMENILPAPDSYDMEMVASEKREGYEARKIVFTLSGFSRVPAYLLVPEGEGPFPAILMLHDHGAHFSIGKEKMVKPFGVKEEVLKDAEEWAVKCYDGQFTGDYFAANGYVVLAVDALLWGERGRKEGADYDAQQALASNFLQLGTSWGGVIATDDVRSAEFLASLPFVDPERIGAAGFSMGAHRAWMTAALTDRIQTTAAICWMNTTDYLMTLTNNQNKGGSAYSMIIPGLRRYLDYPHVASIACPKPMLLFNGIHDKLFPVEGVENAYRDMRHVWESQNAGEKLVTRLWDEKHFFSKEMQKETLLFFDHYLRP